MPEPDLVVIGGGPAGSTAAAAAARAGLSVVLLEASHHPRPHVGESLLPGIIPILQQIDALAAVEAAGFARKTGASHRNWGRTPRWDLWFSDSDAYDHAWLVERDRFDAILFDAAQRAGTRVHPHTRVTELLWNDDTLTGLRWRDRDGTETTARPGLVIDASGSAALCANARDLRRPIEGLIHEALWAHWEGVTPLPAPRQHQAYFVAEPGGWLWVFPLRGGRTSIGVVRLDRPVLSGTRAEYEHAVAQSPALAERMTKGARRVSPVRRERDWSYRVEPVAGPGWMAVGDAAGFIDPILSTGVHLAMHSGWHAAQSAVALLREGDREAPARYAAHHRELFEDLLRMVRFYYQQNVHAEDYFWESKQILMRNELALRPAKAFVILTSGLVGNLALSQHEAERRHQEHARTVGADATSAPLHDPDHLDFICVHLRYEADTPPSSVYVLIEPKEPGARALRHTRNWQLNAIAPRHGNDPISVPAFTRPLREICERLARLDDRPGETLVEFWRRTADTLVPAVRTTAQPLRFVRIFGQ